MKNRGFFIVLIIAFISSFLLAACNANSAKEEEREKLKLYTTDEIISMGLMEKLLPAFNETSEVEIEVVDLNGDTAVESADMFLIANESEKKNIVKNSKVIEKIEVIETEYVLIGPKNDELRLKENSGENIKGALKDIGNAQKPFITVKNNSELSKKENSIWESISFKPEGEWYKVVETGTEEVITVANDEQAYAIVEKRIYDEKKDSLNLDILVENNDNLKNYYELILIESDKDSEKRLKDSRSFLKWLNSKEVKSILNSYKLNEESEATSE